MTKTFGTMTRDEKRAAVKNACTKLQTHFDKPAVKAAISKAFADFDAEVKTQVANTPCDPGYCYAVTQAHHDGKNASVVHHCSTQGEAKGVSEHVWNGGYEGPVKIADYPVGRVFVINDEAN